MIHTTAAPIGGAGVVFGTPPRWGRGLFCLVDDILDVTGENRRDLGAGGTAGGIQIILAVFGHALDELVGVCPAERILGVGADLVRMAFSQDAKRNTVFLPGVMSRKKQIIPALTAMWG